ncbi:acyltransferase [Serinibacter arcticus]|uniref:Acyltransferase n=1 Tax=Serinibacter arcticus TaxID=1655435 RepID=A0A2U1ZYN6_9MICO|nr:acyltransferase family protein [Serinibacter arcticus]PWD52108.1 acyltransferase [Serinibacter arcticus]
MRHASAPTAERRSTAAPGHTPRLDIQGLRALAVGVVVVYHVWPGVLPGGFVGVDVFFVISGFLIIGSLARELERTGTVGLTAFYARRVRRLLPAASVVIVVTTILAFLVLPASQLRRSLGDGVAASLQVANWRFAFGPDSYAEATAGVSPFQHFWSLAIEEQFYIVVPILLLSIGFLVRRAGLRLAPTIVVVLLGLAAASLLWSVVQTANDPGVAYFSTLTRAWELVLGGVAALVLRRVTVGRLTSQVMGAVGLLLVLLTSAVLTTGMPFPGMLALLPVIGTVLMLAAGSGHEPGLVTVGLQARPLTWVGDVSYSLYLWHWPVVVVALALVGPTLGALDGPLVIAVSLVAAGLSERFVERPFRTRSVTRPARARRSQVRIVATGIAVATGVAAGAGIPLVVIDRQLASGADLQAQEYPGALVFAGATTLPMPVAPDPLVAFEDVALVNRDRCIEHDLTTPDPERPATTCRYGPAEAEREMVLVGDSHAGVLSTPLADLAGAEGFELTALVRNGCPFSYLPPSHVDGVPDQCADQNHRSSDLILAEDPDVVVLSAMTAYGYREALGWSGVTYEEMVGGYLDALTPLVEAGIEIVVVRDTPFLPFSAPDCVAQDDDPSDCTAPRSILEEQPDPLVEAATSLEGASVVDLTDHVCRESECTSVEGNVLVYRDNHLTDTYARSLRTALRPAMAWLDA